MIVLGIDPGYALMGWGVVESRGSAMRLLDYGVVETKAGTPVQDRLRTLQQGIRRLVQQYHPDDVAFEELFFARNVTTALTVGAARGAAIIAAAEYTENLYEYTPMQIKQALTGWGKADKKQIQQMVKFLLHLEAIPRRRRRRRHRRGHYPYTGRRGQEPVQNEMTPGKRRRACTHLSKARYVKRTPGS